MHAIHGADPQLTARILDAWANMAANSCPDGACSSHIGIS
jgi:hypothetical protein